MRTIIIDGKRFTKAVGKPYHYNSSLRKHLHQYVWERENGKIPRGYEIHHIDRDKDNNDISNLMLVAVSEHKAIHKEFLWKDNELLERMRKNLEENARPKASKWHGSEEGREWHKGHYENMKDKLHAKININCDECGVNFETTNTGKKNNFCSNKCKSRFRRKSGVDNETRICEWCEGEFVINKYAKTKCCSRSCSGKLSKNKVKR